MKYSKIFWGHIFKPIFGAAAKYLRQPFSDSGASSNKEIRGVFEETFFFWCTELPFHKTKIWKELLLKKADDNFPNEKRAPYMYNEL